jgi:sugar phosphate isomerase/epimerase
VRNENLEITALSPGLFKHARSYRDFQSEMRELFPPAAELAARWHVHSLLVFGFEKTKFQSMSMHDQESTAQEHRKECAEWLAEAAAAAGEYGLRLLLEPEPICWADTGAHAAEMIRGSNATNLFLNYDPGNSAWQLGKDPTGEVMQLIELIRHLHVKDIVAGEVSSAPIWVEPGRGIINYGALFRTLKRSGYDGPVVLEPHLPLNQAILCSSVSAVKRLWKNASDCEAVAGDD